jgi:hypothetical protein
VPARATRGRQTRAWLLAEDEAKFDRLLHERIPCRAWECDKPGPRSAHPRHLHSSLEAALTCGATGALLHLPFSSSQAAVHTVNDVVFQPDRPTIEATVHFLRTRQMSDHTGPHLEVGHIAVEWFPDSVGARVHQSLTEQTRLIWSTLVAATRPAKIEAIGGRPFAGYRIGEAALALVTTTRIPLSEHSLRFRIR